MEIPKWKDLMTLEYLEIKNTHMVEYNLRGANIRTIKLINPINMFGHIKLNSVTAENLILEDLSNNTVRMVDCSVNKLILINSITNISFGFNNTVVKELDIDNYTYTKSKIQCGKELDSLTLHDVEYKYDTPTKNIYGSVILFKQIVPINNEVVKKYVEIYGLCLDEIISMIEELKSLRKLKDQLQ